MLATQVHGVWNNSCAGGWSAARRHGVSSVIELRTALWKATVCLRTRLCRLKGRRRWWCCGPPARQRAPSPCCAVTEAQVTVSEGGNAAQNSQLHAWTHSLSPPSHSFALLHVEHQRVAVVARCHQMPLRHIDALHLKRSTRALSASSDRLSPLKCLHPSLGGAPSIRRRRRAHQGEGGFSCAAFVCAFVCATTALNVTPRALEVRP